MQKTYFDTISPQAYAEFAVIAEEAALQMCSRLELVILQPTVILEMGCGAGEETKNLKTRYPNAHIVGGSEGELPLKEYTVDLIFANFLLPWCVDFKRVLQEWRRVLKPDGLLIFTSLGPDTLSELDGKVDRALFMDMHDVGDHLIEAGFLDPVLEVEHLVFRSLTYEVVYGHAWGPHSAQHYGLNEEGEVRVPISSLKRAELY